MERDVNGVESYSRGPGRLGSSHRKGRDGREVKEIQIGEER